MKIFLSYCFMCLLSFILGGGSFCEFLLNRLCIFDVPALWLSPFVSFSFFRFVNFILLSSSLSFSYCAFHGVHLPLCSSNLAFISKMLFLFFSFLFIPEFSTLFPHHHASYPLGHILSELF